MKELAARGIEFAYPSRTVTIDFPSQVPQRALELQHDAARKRPAHWELKRGGR